MANRIVITNELKAKLIEAKSLDEVKELLKTSGQDISAEAAERLFKEIGTHKTGSELSAEELEAISGGADRDWLTDGCAATVEYGSSCWSDDACHSREVTYLHKPGRYLCPTCKINLYISESTTKREVYKCPRCGYTQEDQYVKAH
ncbi:hypothetical protein [Butyrivibrio sp. AE2032]|uniref:hypothetical protein n=1 Tax=Butyrivibrio sp. AE2032 TaxID=1458463 RepID=UPI000554AB3D|nr:hypothetical protein [Butyrivibrio sp. AE2032]